ncbi:aldose epimerase family protein [Robertkochia solimangrovi]|uniref:aldose epimerase family protein n=1 Tax=Robertkochia solimangrovi TaxID=2213046 RepID=UPI00117FB60A|nr:aldose epimerase family protein [Robertkochia solimangrovi]TRZ42045.1 galactose-1-epimerase [Robertkochia solimangrovi]
MRYFTILALSGVMACLTTSCKDPGEKKNKTDISKEFTPAGASVLKAADFDTLINGKKVALYRIQNEGIQAAFTNYGGRLIGLWVPDSTGKMTDVVVGMNSVDGFINSTEPYFGATIGRVGNRIAQGKFKLDGKEYTIPQNNGENTLHGGIKGFQDVIWNVEKTDDHTLVFTYHSADGEEGFPGNLDVEVIYSLGKNGVLRMEYTANTDAPTVVNLTNHAFFNLNGEGSGSILQHKVQIFADSFTPVDSGLIPTGELRSVQGTPFDFTEPHAIGERIEAENEQLENGMGYDHNFVLNGNKKNGMNHVATITGDKSGIIMDVVSDEPGVQFYSGNFMQGKNTFKSGVTDDFRTAFALETQHFPDAPNQPEFPSIRLDPEQTYHTVSIYSFSVK